MKLGPYPARSLLPGDVTSEGEVVECLGVRPGCCDVYYRGECGAHRKRYLLDEPVEVVGIKGAR